MELQRVEFVEGDADASPAAAEKRALQAQLKQELARLLEQNAALKSILEAPSAEAPSPPPLAVNPWLAVEIPAGIAAHVMATPRSTSRTQLLARAQARNSRGCSRGSRSTTSSGLSSGLVSIAEDRSSCDEKLSYQSSGDEATTVGSERHSSLGGFSHRLASSSCLDSCADEQGLAQTTILVRNVPTSCSREGFLSVLDSAGFIRSYDFVYLPMDLSTGANFGYAVVNFDESEAAEKFRSQFEHFDGWSHPNHEGCTVVWNPLRQGLAALIARYRNSPVMQKSVSDELKPMIFVDGKRVPFPAPNRK